MDSRIEQLVEKYWKCETSLEEENELKAYFATHEVSDEWKDAASLFKYFDHQKKLAMNEDGVARKLNVEMQPKDDGKVKKLVFTTAKIAAGVLVLVAATFLVRQEVRKSYPTDVVDTYSDPELAFKETKKALMMISKGFGKAKQEAGKIRIFNEAEEAIQNGPGQKDPEEERI
ncbi:MAG: hypothetical protein R2820_09525 [Cyclobacteriaceae bacterium]|nr:hypothetical protein [Cyclobacteriaceae bacterium]